MTKLEHLTVFCNALQAKTVQAAGLKFSVRIPITIREHLKKKRRVNIYSGTTDIAILKSLLFSDGALIYLRPLYIKTVAPFEHFIVNFYNYYLFKGARAAYVCLFWID